VTLSLNFLSSLSPPEFSFKVAEGLSIEGELEPFSLFLSTSWTESFPRGQLSASSEGRKRRLSLFMMRGSKAVGHFPPVVLFPRVSVRVIGSPSTLSVLAKVASFFLSVSCGFFLAGCLFCEDTYHHLPPFFLLREISPPDTQHSLFPLRSHNEKRPGENLSDFLPGPDALWREK